MTAPARSPGRGEAERGTITPGLPRRVPRRASLAGRLARWYAASAFLLVAVATGLQYRTLVASLRAEDDQLLRERLGDARADAAVTGAKAPAAEVTPADQVGGRRAPETGPAEPPGDLVVRYLDAACRPVEGLRAREPLPAPRCPAAAGRGGATRPGAGVTFRTTHGLDGDEWRVAVAPRPGGWVEVLLDRSRDREVLTRFRAEAALVLGGALAAAAALGYGIARRGLRPLAALGAQVARVDARALGLRLAAPDAPTEVAALTAAFDAMLGRLQGAFDALSTRAGELAHELRTPLHVLRQQAEVALARARTPAEYREVLESSLEELDRLRRLADDTLFLARAADPRAAVTRVRLDVRAELADVADYLEALADERGVRLAVQAPAALTVSADRALLRRALVNLVTNAVRHTPPGGAVTLRGEWMPAEGGDAGAVALAVEDTGPGVPPDLLPRAFEPYARGAGGGAGLGLAIVRGIAALHAGTAAITSPPGGGTRAVLVLPVDPS